MEVLRTEKLCKNFGRLVVMDDVSLTVNSDDGRVVIIGPNGAGKTTLFNLISGEVPPSSGNIFLFLKDITRMPNHKRCHLGLSRTFQVVNLFSNFTVMDNVLMALKAHAPFRFQMLRPLASFKEIFKRATTLIEQIGLFEKRNFTINTLSHGEMRQVELMMGIACNPKVLLLDEPAAGLTSSEAKEFLALLKRISGEITLITIEHDMTVAFELADRIIVLDQGQILADGKPSEIAINPRVREVYLGEDL